MKKGFTLVELSVVLVIIGLLIGGILAAQSMISTARVQSQIRQIEQYDAMVTNFRTIYKYMPGDSPTFTVAGNGNNRLGAPTPGGLYLGFGNEAAEFWPHLSQSGMTPGVIYSDTRDATGILKPGLNVPKAEFPNGGLGVWGLSTTDLYYFYVLAQFTNTSGYLGAMPGCISNAICQGVMYPSEALAIDTKIDDGNAASGVSKDLQRLLTVLLREFIPYL